MYSYSRHLFCFIFKLHFTRTCSILCTYTSDNASISLWERNSLCVFDIEGILINRKNAYQNFAWRRKLLSKINKSCNIFTFTIWRRSIKYILKALKLLIYTKNPHDKWNGYSSCNIIHKNPLQGHSLKSKNVFNTSEGHLRYFIVRKRNEYILIRVLSRKTGRREMSYNGCSGDSAPPGGLTCPGTIVTG